MALQQCKECGGQVAATASKCPHCGVSNPAMSTTDYLIATVVVGGFFVAASMYLFGGESGDSDPAISNADPCVSNWRECDDNADLVNNFEEITYAQGDCERAAESRAKYGEPDFPWISFGTFQGGTNYVETGEITLIEDEAKFQNAFGTMAKTTVRCVYDLTTESVKTLSIEKL